MGVPEPIALLTPEQIWDYGPIFGTMPLRGVEACLIYYCAYGRNAWHSTWTSRYTHDCMHPSFRSAQLFAEQSRKQGSVFYIQALPALKLKAEGRVFLITQINERKPLREYSADALRESPGEDVKPNDRRDNYLTSGAPLNGVLSSFSCNSRFWGNRQPQSNSVIVLIQKGQDSFSSFSQAELRLWKSISVGVNYYMNWDSIKNEVDGSAILGLVDNAKIEEN